MSSNTRATDRELDDALARAIRQLIAEAVEGTAAAAGAAAAEPRSAGAWQAQMAA